jgi:hemoglobin
MDHMRKLLFVSLLAFSTATIATADDKAKTAEKKAPDAAPAAKSLYDRLGGKDAITKVVEDFLGNVGLDKAINKRFAKSDLKKLKTSLVDQVCQATGGPCKYKGKDMATAHKGMKITEEEFNALVGDLKKSLDKFKVGDTEQKELLGALGGMKGDIVGK